MIPVLPHPGFSRQPDRLTSSVRMCCTLILVLAAWLPSACTRFSPADVQRDMAAEQVVARLIQTNTGLTRFKCVGKMILVDPGQPTQSFRAAMAGQLPDRLRIDLFSPFGGSTGTVASDGKNLFLVMHHSREYYKRRLGSGSLSRLVHLDVTVGDLLELMVGRIPMRADWPSRLTIDADERRSQLVFVDRRGRLRQRIRFDDQMQPVGSEWFDASQQPAYTLTLEGHQVADGFILPERIELHGPKGERVSMVLERYEADVELDQGLFVPARPRS